MKLIDYMRSENLDDAAMAARAGGITGHGIRKLKYGERGPSIEVAIRIGEVTAGLVGLNDWSKEAGSPHRPLAADDEARARAKPLRCFSPHDVDLSIEGQSR